MSESSSTAGWHPSPFLHRSPERLYNPHVDAYMDAGEYGFAVLCDLLDSGRTVTELNPGLQALVEQGWLVAIGEDLSYRWRLKYVSLEAHTTCNHRCYFCPVSVVQRPKASMSTEMYERLVREVADLGEPIEAVVMISYNEPTLDPRFIEQVRCIKQAGLPPATLSNGSGLTPAVSDALVELGGLSYLSINLSTIDRERYRRDRGRDQLPTVLAHVDYAKDRPVAEQMEIVVLGTGDAEHAENVQAIRDRFAGSRFVVKDFIANDRAGYLEVGLKAPDDETQLCGCDYMGSRPVQHLHITARGRCILCCQDYHEEWEVGDLNRQSVREVLDSPEFARARRWVYGLEEPPERFLCHGCPYALRR